MPLWRKAVAIMSDISKDGTLKCGWAPHFPIPKERGVRILGDVCTISVMSGTVAVSTCGSDAEDIPVDPACIFIDEKHVYIRRNWESWYPVDVSNRLFVQKLMSVPSCSMYDSVGGEIKEHHIPVFKMSNFPKVLFRADQLDAALGSATKGKDSENPDSETEGRPPWRIKRVPPAIEACMKGLEADTFPNVIMDGHRADLAFSTQHVAVVCNIWKSDDPLEAEKMEEDLNFIREELLSNEPESECHIVLLSDSPGMVKTKFEATMVMTESGLIGFLRKTFKKTGIIK